MTYASTYPKRVSCVDANLGTTWFVAPRLLPFSRVAARLWRQAANACSVELNVALGRMTAFTLASSGM